MSRPSRFSADCTRRLRFAVNARPWLAFAVFAAVLVIPLVTFVGLDRPVWADEVGYFATVRYFGDHFRFATLADYDQVTPPLAYFVYAAWGKVVGFDFSSLRILSLVLAVSNVCAAVRSESRPTSRSEPSTLLLSRSCFGAAWRGRKQSSSAASWRRCGTHSTRCSRRSSLYMVATSRPWDTRTVR